MGRYSPQKTYQRDFAARVSFVSKDAAENWIGRFRHIPSRALYRRLPLT